jgi:predicted metal-binding transcription factor (methanogenesis marker protein 9)
MKQILFFFCLLAAGCCKDKPPVKKCYTVTNVHVLSYTPDRFRVTFSRPGHSYDFVTGQHYTLGYNTCTGYNWNNNFRPLIP